MKLALVRVHKASRSLIVEVVTTFWCVETLCVVRSSVLLSDATLFNLVNVIFDS